MAAAFDPYHRWLGISRNDQPPNHYRLLGLEMFESTQYWPPTSARQATKHWVAAPCSTDLPKTGVNQDHSF